jgi:DNA-binding NtrC family response regulator
MFLIARGMLGFRQLCTSGSFVFDQKRILFVDDEPSIRLTLPPILEENGFAVTTAASVAEAISRIQAHRFDVLLSDLNVGEDGDGFLVVGAMREAQPNCVVLILTGYPGFESAIHALRHKVDDYLVKPADVDSMISLINTKIAERAADRNTSN